MLVDCSPHSEPCCSQLLSSTDIIWSALFAYIINKERPPKLGFIAVFVVLIGAVVSAIGAVKADHSDYSEFDRVFGKAVVVPWLTGRRGVQRLGR